MSFVDFEVNACRALDMGIHVITPNKRLTSAPFDEYHSVQRAQFHEPDGTLRLPGGARRVFYEVSTVPWCYQSPRTDARSKSPMALHQA